MPAKRAAPSKTVDPHMMWWCPAMRPGMQRLCSGLAMVLCVVVVLHFVPIHAYAMQWGVHALHVSKDGVLFLVRLVLRDVYMQGRMFHGGATESQICATLTNVDAGHWVLHPEQCKVQIDNDFESWVVTIGAVLHVALLGYLVVFTLHAVCGCTRSVALACRANPQEAHSTRTTPTRLLMAWIERFTPRRRPQHLQE